MRTALYSLRDKLHGIYLPPFHASHDVTAVRAIVSIINDPKAKLEGNNVANYPAEFELCRMSHFDDVEGIIPGDAKPVVLGRCDQLSKNTAYFPDQP